MVNLTDLEFPITIDEEYGFVTPFVLVYGTLRKNQGNYNKILVDRVKHLGTFRIKKFALSGITANYTGNPKDSIVVDLFKLKNNTDIEVIKSYEVNAALDKLESSGLFKGSAYSTLILPIEFEDKIIRAKLYISNIVPRSYGLTGDYVSQHKYLDYETLNIVG